jgi:hypothetical protein
VALSRRLRQRVCVGGGGTRQSRHGIGGGGYYL